MTIGQRMHYADLLRRAREEHILMLSAVNGIVKWNERGHRRLLADMEARTLEAIVSALGALGKEPAAYGRCEECGEEIPPQVLDATPWARTCDRHTIAAAC